MELNEKRAQEVLRQVAHAFRAAKDLEEALNVAVQAKERGDKAELRARELETQVEAKQQQLQKLATTVLAAEGSAADYLAKLTASRKTADAELSAYVKELADKRIEAEREYRAKVQEFNALFAEMKRKSEQERAAEKAAHEKYMEETGREIQEKQKKIAELQAIIDEMKRKLGQV